VISVLVVGAGAHADAAGFAEADAEPSVEVLAASDAEDALEKLARNRRVDAVLILDAREAARIVALLREDFPVPPPVYAAAGAPPLAGVRPLPDPPSRAARLLERILRDLQEVPESPPGSTS